MREQINIALIQADLLWENVDGNLEQMEDYVAQVKEDTDLLILPETFSTGFTMRADRFTE
jgi:predicted amidohydrolase